ncbi:MAG: hypothetical protein JRI22_20405 [Deltaproteobacteria bacterium]|nr:hypothetical protein [Deltaproteobacteria bacterium]
MKIEKVELFYKDVPCIRAHYMSVGILPKKSPILIVKIFTDEGIIGYGDLTSFAPYVGEDFLTAAHTIKRYLVPNLIGIDPFDIEEAHRRMDMAVYANHYAKTAIDVALYDIMGKALGVPVYKLLGGKCREKMLVSWTVATGDIRRDVEESKDRVAAGYRFIRLKVGYGWEIKQEIERIRKVREAIGDTTGFGIDVNQGWNPKDAIEVLRAVDDCGLLYVEQPVPRLNVEGLKLVKECIRIPVMADECVFSIQDLQEIIKRQAADMVNIKLLKFGGLLPARKALAVAESANMPAHQSEFWQTEIGKAADAHFGVSGTNFMEESGFELYTIREKAIADNPLRFEKGYIYPPEGPGLGVEIEDERLYREWSQF